MKISNDSFYKLKTLVPLFRGFTEDELVRILRLSNSKLYEKGESIFKEKDPGESLFIIVKGSVKITKKVSLEFEEVLAMLKAGNYFGEMAIIDNLPRSAAAFSDEDNTMLLEIRRTVLNFNVSLAFKVYKNFCMVLSQRLRDTNDKLINVNGTKLDIETRMKAIIKNKINAPDSKLSYSNFKGSDMKGIYFDRVQLHSSVLMNANLEDAKFKHSSFEEAHFSGSDIQACIFENCNFKEANFINATFLKTVFKNCQFNDKTLSKMLNS